MKASHYLAVAVRVFALFSLLYAFKQSSILIEVFSTGGINGMDISTVFVASTVVCPLVIAVVLWVYPCTVANILLKPEIDHPIEPMRAKELLTVFILGIGSLSLYNAVIDSVYWATWWQMSLNSQYSAAPLILDVNTKSSMAATALELIVAAIIVFKARTLASKILRLAT